MKTTSVECRSSAPKWHSASKLDELREGAGKNLSWKFQLEEMR